jgi:Fic family protein
MPRGELRPLSELSRQLLLRAGGLRQGLPPASIEQISKLVIGMNSYYSNLIEGHRTFPGEMETVRKEGFSSDPKKVALQKLGFAHEEVEQLMRERLKQEPEIEPCSKAFVCWLHRELYERLPAEFQTVKNLSGDQAHPVVPGQFRDHPAGVGQHGAPDHAQLDSFMNRFRQAYASEQILPTDQLIAAMAAHHRFMWIHPFSDGNGRVARLMTTACLIRAGVDDWGLWSWARGLARSQSQYYAYLEEADHPRRGDRDGRGALSESSLRAFIHFALQLALDQIDFMCSKLDLLKLETRMEDFFRREQPIGTPKQVDDFVRISLEVLRRGELPRGQVGSLVHKAERASSLLIKQLESAGYVTSDGPKKSLKIAFPSDLRNACFPGLYIAG